MRRISGNDGVKAMRGVAVFLCCYALYCWYLLFEKTSETGCLNISYSFHSPKVSADAFEYVMVSFVFLFGVNLSWRFSDTHLKYFWGVLATAAPINLLMFRVIGEISDTGFLLISALEFTGASLVACVLAFSRRVTDMAGRKEGTEEV